MSRMESVMSKSMLSQIISDPKVRAFFRDELKLTEEELQRRVRVYLELFPFIAIDFDLMGPNEDRAIVMNKFLQRERAYRELLKDLQEQDNWVDMDIKL
jgi:hypothetical protein